LHELLRVVVSNEALIIDLCDAESFATGNMTIGPSWAALWVIMRRNELSLLLALVGVCVISGGAFATPATSVKSERSSAQPKPSGPAKPSVPAKSSGLATTTSKPKPKAEDVPTVKCYHLVTKNGSEFIEKTKFSEEDGFKTSLVCKRATLPPYYMGFEFTLTPLGKTFGPKSLGLIKKSPRGAMLTATREDGSKTIMDVGTFATRRGADKQITAFATTTSSMTDDPSEWVSIKMDWSGIAPEEWGDVIPDEALPPKKKSN